MTDDLWSRVGIPDANTGCMLWLGTPNDKGYGRIKLNGKLRYAHRVVYENAYGPIPDGLDIDHLCRNRMCVRPDHLEPVTRQENIRRGLVGESNRVKTHCPNGHPFAGDNLRTKRHGSGTKRICVTCTREWDREYKRARRKAVV